MARIYRLQINSVCTQALKEGKDIVTDIMAFDSDDEKYEFVSNPEGFSRKVGFITDDMPFNGLKLSPGITLEELQKNSSLIARAPDVVHESSCQLAWDI